MSTIVSWACIGVPVFRETPSGGSTDKVTNAAMRECTAIIITTRSKRSTCSYQSQKFNRIASVVLTYPYNYNVGEIVEDNVPQVPLFNWHTMTKLGLGASDTSRRLRLGIMVSKTFCSGID